MGEERSLFEVFWWGAKLCERASAIAVGWERAIAFWGVLVECDRCGIGEERSPFGVFWWGGRSRCGMGEGDRFLRCFGGERSLWDGRGAIAF